MKMIVHTKQKTYPIYMERGILRYAKEFIGECGKPFLISDDGVPEKWRHLLQAQFPDSYMHVIPHGESSKSFPVYQETLEAMLEHHVSRNDTVIALGGGVVGDLAGFCAATYMRGIRYVNIPTTTLSQIDSGIGGKTAIDLNGVKNSVGAFHQPEKVLVDLDVLSTLSRRHFHNGLAEAVKAGLILDAELFSIFEQDDWEFHLDEIIERSLMVKKKVVEEDEKESGLRKLLNFGHTYGHAYESYYELDRYYHGECVAMGMMTVLRDEEIRQRLAKVLEKLELPLACDAPTDAVCALIANDKKTDHAMTTVVLVDTIGKAHMEQWDVKQIKEVAEK